MKRIRKIIATLAVCTLAFSAMGCKMIEKTPEAIQKTVYATVGNTKITKADFEKEFEDYLQNYYRVTIDDLKQQYGDDYENNTQIKEQILNAKQGAMQNYINTELMNQQTEISVSDDDVNAEYDKQLAQLKESYTEEGSFEAALTENGFTEESFEETQKKQIKMNLIYQKIVEDIDVTDEEVETYYNENKDKSYTQGAGANTAHILIAEKNDSGEIDYDASLAKANDVKAKLDAGSDFAELAKEYGTDGTKDSGGDLGYVEYDKQNFDEDFLAGLKTLKEGEVSAPVKTQFGYHIIKATGLKDSSVTPLEEVKDQIKSQLLQQKQAKAYTDKINEWKESIKVNIKEKSLEPSQSESTESTQS